MKATDTPQREPKEKTGFQNRIAAKRCEMLDALLSVIYERGINQN